MMTAILPDTDVPINTLTSDRLDEVGSDVQSRPNDGAGAIVIRIGLDGICSVQILAEESTAEDDVRARLTAARPLLDALRTLFIVDHHTGQEIR